MPLGHQKPALYDLDEGSQEEDSGEVYPVQETLDGFFDTMEEPQGRRSHRKKLSFADLMESSVFRIFGEDSTDREVLRGLLARIPGNLSKECENELFGAVYTLLSRESVMDLETFHKALCGHLKHASALSNDARGELVTLAENIQLELDRPSSGDEARAVLKE